MIRKIREKINISVAKSPKKAVLVGIMLFNVVFIMTAGGIIAALSHHMSGVTEGSFWESVYRTITMMLDAGCIEGVIKDVGKAGAIAAIVCLTVVIVGMVFFSGAVIGYVTNCISDFIDSKNNGRHKLILSDHIVLINWNARAGEIINEYLFGNRKVKVVIFVPDHKEEIEGEIRNRLDMTLLKEAQRVYKAAESMSFLEKRRYLRENLPEENMTYIVREGDVAAATDLDDVCITKAKTVIILDRDGSDSGSRDREKGNTQTIKTLIQVSEQTKDNRDQIILVEVTDHWTEDLVCRIIAFRDEGRRIIPISCSRLLGITNAQIAILPEINDVYDELFSNQGPHFISRSIPEKDSGKKENACIAACLSQNCRSVPLAVTETSRGRKAVYLAKASSDLAESGERITVKSRVKLKDHYSFKKRSIVVLGHNSNMDFLMEGFDSFRAGWNLKEEEEWLRIVMVDDEESLKSHNYYRKYPYVETLAADVFEDETINNKVSELSRSAPEDTTVLILSDDSVENEDVDANVLTYLIYIQGQIRRREMNEPDFRRDNLKVIVEILNPKNEEAVKSYGADQVIISNRYVSRVISQISLGEAIYDFYAEMLTYDSGNQMDNGRKVFLIAAEDFFEEIPGKCTACELIRMVFASGEEGNQSITLGYIREGREYVFFQGDQRRIDVELKPGDMLILFSSLHRRTVR